MTSAPIRNGNTRAICRRNRFLRSVVRSRGMMGPVMESLAEEYAGKVRIYKVNVDKEKRLAAIFRVRSIPTFLFIPMSGEPKHANGAMEIAQMRRIIDTTLLEH